jgi:hypothetical protein
MKSPEANSTKERIPNDAAVQAYVRELDHRVKRFRSAFNEMLLALSDTSDESRRSKALSLQKAAEDIGSMLVAQDWPRWLGPIRESAGQFASAGGVHKAQELAAKISEHFVEVSSGSISILDAQPSPYDFDRLYEEARSDALISELFDAHIAAIERIIESGCIESVTVLTALRQLVQVLRANRAASYAAVRQSLFIARFINNTILIALKQVPGLGILVEATEKTLEESEDALDIMDSKLNEMTRNAMVQSLPRIESARDLIEQQMLALPHIHATVDTEE